MGSTVVGAVVAGGIAVVFGTLDGRPTSSQNSKFLAQFFSENLFKQNSSHLKS